MADKVLVQGAKEMYRAGMYDPRKYEPFKQRLFKSAENVTRAIQADKRMKQQQQQYDQSMAMQKERMGIQQEQYDQSIALREKSMEWQMNNYNEQRDEQFANNAGEFNKAVMQFQNNAGTNEIELSYINDITDKIKALDKLRYDRGIEVGEYTDKRGKLLSRLNQQVKDRETFVDIYDDILGTDPLTMGDTPNIYNVSAKDADKISLLREVAEAFNTREYDKETGRMSMTYKWNGAEKATKRWWDTDLLRELNGIDVKNRGKGGAIEKHNAALQNTSNSGKYIGDQTKNFINLVTSEDGNQHDTYLNTQAVVSDFEFGPDAGFMYYTDPKDGTTQWNPDYAIEQGKYMKWFNEKAEATGEKKRIKEDQGQWFFEGTGNKALWHTDRNYSGKGKEGTDLVEWAASTYNKYQNEVHNSNTEAQIAKAKKALSGKGTDVGIANAQKDIFAMVNIIESGNLEGIGEIYKGYKGTGDASTYSFINEMGDDNQPSGTFGFYRDVSRSGTPNPVPYSDTKYTISNTVDGKMELMNNIINTRFAGSDISDLWNDKTEAGQNFRKQINSMFTEKVGEGSGDTTGDGDKQEGDPPPTSSELEQVIENLDEKMETGGETLELLDAQNAAKEDYKLALKREKSEKRNERFVKVKTEKALTLAQNIVKDYRSMRDNDFKGYNPSALLSPTTFGGKKLTQGGQFLSNVPSTLKIRYGHATRNAIYLLNRALKDTTEGSEAYKEIEKIIETLEKRS